MATRTSVWNGTSLPRSSRTVSVMRIFDGSRSGWPSSEVVTHSSRHTLSRMS